MTATALKVYEEAPDHDNDNDFERSLPALVKRAARTLDSATNAAEVLEAREQAGFVYDAAKRAARLARAKGAHDELIAKIHRAQADALELEAMAKRRLADEYDAAQERGDIRKNGERSFSAPEKVSGPDILPPKELHEARQIRDAEVDDPGIVRRTLDALLEVGEEPTKAAVKREITNHRALGTGENEWYTPVDYIDLARQVMGGFDLDPASSEIANKTVGASHYYTEDMNGLDKEWRGRVWCNPPYAQPAISYFAEKMADEVSSGNVRSAIMLTHNYTDTRWFHTLAATARAICFTRGRIKFESPSGAKAAPTQGQAFFYFGDSPKLFRDVFSDVGFVVEVMRSEQT